MTNPSQQPSEVEESYCDHCSEMTTTTVVECDECGSIKFDSCGVCQQRKPANEYCTNYCKDVVEKVQAGETPDNVVPMQLGHLLSGKVKPVEVFRQIEYVYHQHLATAVEKVLDSLDKRLDEEILAAESNLADHKARGHSERVIKEWEGSVHAMKLFVRPLIHEVRQERNKLKGDK